MKQTAVEFAIEAYEKFINSENGNGEAYFHKQLVKDIEQAKAMEKEQIIEAFDEGQEYEYQYHINLAPKFYSETYYQETYGQGSNDTTSNNN